MPMVLRGGRASEAGFTLMELLITVLIVGILAAVGVPLYLGYVRDSRLAEAKALAGVALTAAQSCAEGNPGNEATECTLVKLASKIGVSTAGLTGDTRWVVALPGTITLNSTTDKFGGPVGTPSVTVAGQVAPVTNMATGIFLDANGDSTLRCTTSGTAVTSADGTC